VFPNCFIFGLALAAPRFTTPTEVESNNGSVLLEWEAEQAATTYQVEQSASAEFDHTRVVYDGRMPSAHVSGLLPGRYHFRLRARDESGAWSQWSPSVDVGVVYQPMWAVLTSLGLGAAVFVLTGGFVLARARREDTDA
jgi:hypothetical protein